MVWIVALIGLALACIQAWEEAALYGAIFLVCLVLWQIDRRELTHRNVPRIPVESTQPKTKELVMPFGPAYTLLATAANIACIVVLFQMYYLGVTERVIQGVSWSYFMFATPAVLAIVIVNNLSAKNRSGTQFWRAIDGIFSALLMIFVWITAILASSIISPPTTALAPVLTSYTALVLIWTLAAWTLYDVFSNQKSNMYELLTKYPNARVVFTPQQGTAMAQNVASDGTASMSLAEAINSGNQHVGTAVPQHGEMPYDFHLVPYLVMPNGNRVRLTRMPEMIDVTPNNTAQQAADAPAQQGGPAPVH